MTSKPSQHTAPFIPYRWDYSDDYFYPDPEPEPDNMEQGSTNRECAYLLENHFPDRHDVLVDDGGEIYWDRNDRIHHKVKPDLYVAFGVDAATAIRRHAYLVWEVGKPPDFVLELASPTTHHVDTGRKPGIYQSIGVSEYWRFDPVGGEYYGYVLAGDILVDGVYQPIPISATAEGPLLRYSRELDGLPHGYSLSLDLVLCVLEGRLRFFDPKTGGFLSSISEERTARQAAEAEADQERAARRNAESEADRLRAELRRLQGQ